MMKLTTILISLLISVAAQERSIKVHITDSDAIDLARMIARNEGYDVARTSIYSFELLRASGGNPFLQGYTAIGFDINGNHRNLIMISESTGQAIDYNTCEVFDYPDLTPFQERMTALSKAKRKSARELANDVGCAPPKVLRTPLPIPRRKTRDGKPGNRGTDN